MARRWVAAGRRDSIALARAAMEALSPRGLLLVATFVRRLVRKCPIAGPEVLRISRTAK
jgi:hypothetical protein